MLRSITDSAGSRCDGNQVAGHNRYNVNPPQLVRPQVYVQTASALGKKIHLDFTTDPPPDIAVEMDVHNNSIAKFPSYAVLGIPEIWRYEGTALTIHRLQGPEYVSAPSSVALPVLDASTLTRFLNLLSEKDQYDVLVAFEEWLDSLPR